MQEGKEKILGVISNFSGQNGEPRGSIEVYTLKAMWLMMLSEFESSVKNLVENYIDNIKRKNISDIHICLLIRHFWGDKEEPLTPNKIISFYKKKPEDISYANFTRDRVPKYKSQALEKLFNNLGIFFTEEERIQLHLLDGIASTHKVYTCGGMS